MEFLDYFRTESIQSGKMADGQNNAPDPNAATVPAPIVNAADGNAGGDGRTAPQTASRKYMTIVEGINRHCDFISSPNLDNQDYTRSDVRYERSTELWKELNELHLHVIDGVDDVTASYYEKTLESVEDRYMEGLSLLRIHIDGVHPLPNPLQPGNRSDQSSEKQPIHVEVKMPQPVIKNIWGKFDGDLTKWKGFHDRYVADLHNKTEYSVAQKYSHLKQSLQGSAAQVFGDGEPNEATYNEAWERLKKVHDRKYLICRAHIHRMFD